MVALTTFGLGLFMIRHLRAPQGRRLRLVRGEPDKGLPPDDELPIFEPPQNRSDALELDLRRAGYCSPGARNWFEWLRLALVGYCAFTAASVATVLGPRYHSAVLVVASLGACGAGLSWALPRIGLRSTANFRVQRILRSLPSVLDLTAMCLGGGMSLREAVFLVGRETGTLFPELAIELELVHRQSDLLSMDFALAQLSRRLEIPEVANFANVASQADRLGVHVANSVQLLADQMRLKEKQQAEERANILAVQLLLPIAFCLLPSIVMLLLGPAAVELMKFFSDGGAGASR